ncbi:MAG: hypothetical protein RLZZ15_996 [Verrucomicrobiota bacterium]|jgi:hypothetical protein
MSNELFTAYWSGGEPTGSGKSPTLDQTPDYIDVVELYELGINADGSLDDTALVKYHSQATIKGWISGIRSRQAGTNYHTRFTLCVLGGSIVYNQDPTAFAQTIKAAVDDWGVDGVTIDYEPPSDDTFIVAVVTAIRAALGDSALMIAPVYAAWLAQPLRPLQAFAQVMDYVETMDYGPYPGLKETKSLYESYAAAIGGPGAPAFGKVIIGVSCENPTNDRFTPLADVVSLCAYEPAGGTKAGMMLFTTSYDIKSRPNRTGNPQGGTGLPDGTFARTIHAKLP